ncbi:MAG: hypothetical protein LUI39_14840 [Lachnospiraceae bacterium]|nr:hypothetical protein [Lachnospiraceae bacterium]
MKSSPQVLRDVYLELCKDAETWSVTNNAAGLIEFDFAFSLCSDVSKSNDLDCADENP